MAPKKGLFTEKCIIGMVHCLPLPGTLGYGGNMKKVTAQAVEDARTLERAGFTAIIVENMGDGPFKAIMDTEQRIALAAVSAMVRQAVSIPVGIDAAFCDYEAGLATAVAVDAQFIRVPVFVDTVVTAYGVITPCAHELVRYRRTIGAEHIQLFTDVHVKHSHPLVESVSVVESAKAAAESGADAIIVTGAAIGMETPLATIELVKKSVKLPVVAGSGFSTHNAKEQLKIADGAIVGSSLKPGGDITAPIDLTLAQELMRTVK